MLQISPSSRIFVCVQLVDFRKGIDGLAAVCRNIFDQDPFQGTVFVFRNRGRTTIRLLVYDGQGFWLCTKRLSKGTFRCGLPIHLLWMQSICRLFCGTATPNQLNFLIIGKKSTCNKILIWLKCYFYFLHDRQ